jgi:septal ring factor EnvC (AmiA/AmiB activator)
MTNINTENIDLENIDNSLSNALSDKTDELQKLIDVCDKLVNENVKLQQSIAQLRTDIEKLKGQLNDKVSKPLFTELECKMNQHTKSIDMCQRKNFEFGTKLEKFIDQPVSHTLVENIRKQLTDEIMTNIKAFVDPLFENTRKLIDEKNNETRLLINKTKNFFYTKK